MNLIVTTTSQPSQSAISNLLQALDKPHIVHSDIAPLILEFSKYQQVTLTHLGNSFEGKPIQKLSIGQGDIKVLMWTQMHGDEATATMMVFDFLQKCVEEPTDQYQDYLKTYTFDIIPMVNPDGAERRIRHNAQGIDINRDAQALQTIEGNILMDAVKCIRPDIALNLHDQSPFYQTGITGNPATIAFLAPAFDVEKSQDRPRQLAMALIDEMTQALEPHIPNTVARYDDTYSVRSFGDNVAGLGAATILVESGAARKDPNRQIARALNLVAVERALDVYPTLTAEEDLSAHINRYFAIPENRAKAVSSVLIKNLRFIGAHCYQASVAINQTTRWSNEYMIDSIGDLLNQAGLVEFDASDLTFECGKVYEIDSFTSITDDSLRDWLSKGVIQFQGEVAMFENKTEHQLLFNQPMVSSPNALILQQPAYFLMKRKDKIVAAVVNGQIIEL